MVSRVSAPFRARARPVRLAPVTMVMLLSAIRLPWKFAAEPSVAELPTCQYTAHAWAPFTRRTAELLAVVSALPIWKMKTPLPLSVSEPVSCAEELR